MSQQSSGKQTWNPAQYATYTQSVSSKSTQQIFSNTQFKKEFDPAQIVMRESRDSIEFPLSTPLIIAGDVTGSMQNILDVITRTGVGTTFEQTLARKPVTDPQVMFMGVGDVVNGDPAPLQVTQFETDMRIVEQLNDIWLVGGGGGNGFESYNLPWYFAAFKTSIDAFEVRGRKGYLFTYGDDGVPPNLRPEHINQVFGDSRPEGISNEALLAAVQRMYHVFHIVVNRGHKDYCFDQWHGLLGENALFLEDHTKLSELVVSTMEIIEGADPVTVAKSWGGDTALVIANATRSLTAAGKAGGAAVKRF